MLEIEEHYVEYCGVNQCSNPSSSESTPEDVQFALRLFDNVLLQSNLLSGLGEGNSIATTVISSSDSEAEEDNTNKNTVHIPIDIEGTNIVRKLNFESFRAKLITHFDIQYQKKVLEWPVAQGINI